MKQNIPQRVSLLETALCLNERKSVQNAIRKMTVFSAHAGEYGLFYHPETDDVVVKRVRYRTEKGCYFMTKDDAYACLLLVGETRMKKYLRQGGNLC